jgi:hypothetical protein
MTARDDLVRHLGRLVFVGYACRNGQSDSRLGTLRPQNLGVDVLLRLAQYPLGNVNRRHEAKPLVFALQGFAQHRDCFRQMGLESLFDVVRNLWAPAGIARLAFLKSAAMGLWDCVVHFEETVT